MAYAAYTNENVAFDGNSGVLAQLKQRFANYRLYLRTLGELDALTDRDLADLGISRFDVKQLAWDSVYAQ